MVPPLDDFHHRVLAHAEITPDQTIAEAFPGHLKHLPRLLVRRSLAGLTAKRLAFSASCRQARLDPFPNKVTLKVAIPAMIVHISLPVDVAKSNASPFCASTLIPTNADHSA